jgi:hypothetical protein
MPSTLVGADAGAVTRGSETDMTHSRKLTDEQLQFWRPYIELIGEDNFVIKKASRGPMDFVHSKHYVGFDVSSLGQSGEPNRTVAIHRENEYRQLLSKPALTADDIDTIFTGLVEKAYFDSELVFILTEHNSQLSDEEYWNVVIDCWCRQEFTTAGGRGDNWRTIFDHRLRPESLIADLPDTFVAYRAGEEDGFSWTLDESVADWFRQRFEEQFDDVPMHKRTFERTDAVFYTNRRKEQEVVILPLR